MNKKEYIKKYLKETAEIANAINQEMIESVCKVLLEVKAANGRVFFLGVGGGAATGSHAANDFNKIAGIPTICLSDNPALLTALVNDEGWDSVFKRQLEMHNLNKKDCLFVYSVGGGTETVSRNLVLAIDYAREKGSKIVGVVGKDTGATAQKSNAYVLVPEINEKRRTAHTEDFQMVLDHLIVNLIAEIINEKSDIS